MRKLFVLAAILCLTTASRVHAQAGTGALEFTAKVTPSAAKPEPVRDFTFYVLTKSYDDIVKDLETNSKKVQHQTGGIVGEILVKEGDRVSAGDVKH